MQIEGYPFYYFIIISAIGLIFLLWRPKYNFWFALFFLSIRNLQRSALTRFEGMGPYFNLDDFVISILLFSLIRISTIRRIKIPSAVIWLSICFFISIMIISLNYHFTYEVKREHKSTIYFIIAIFLSYNFIFDEKDLKYFLQIVFIGSIIASLQYLILTQERLQVYNIAIIQENIRSVAFIGFIPSIVISSFFIKLKWLGSTSIRLIHLVGLSLMLVNLILSQTRSLLISIILTILSIYLINREVKIRPILILIFILIAIPVKIIFSQYLNIMNLSEVIFGRLQLLFDNPAISDSSTISRVVAIKYEFNAFLNSNIIFGNGLGFTNFISVPLNIYVAWGHIGHLAYLARLGVIGFLVYSIYIPFTSFKCLFNLRIEKLKLPYTKMFIFFSMALIISDWIGFWMSASYLGMGASLSGLVIGIVWAIKDKRITITHLQNSKKINELSKN